MENTQAASTLPGVKVLIEGPSGTGKTRAIATAVEADPKLQVFVLALDPGLESLFAYWKDVGKEIPPNLHWHFMAPPKASFTELQKDAELINTMSYEGLTKLRDPNIAKHDQYRNLFNVLNDFPDDRTGKKFGPVDSWGCNSMLVIDGMTGLGNASMANVIGGKAVISPSDWGVAQKTLEKLLRMITEGCECHFMLIAHVERETDPVLGGSKIMTSTLGKALAPKIPSMFSDVILTVREGTKWTWDTANPLADLKTRNLEYKAGLLPDFKHILDKWKKRGGVIS
jgi:hypothetical protein